MNSNISRIKKVPLRDLWKDEAKDFTSWLEKNIDYLNEQIGLKISIHEKEKRVGDFFVDLVGEDENGTVIIENQLERTDHDHFGKILTYLTMVGAKTAIWISSEPRDEHVKALEWLNEVTPPDHSFYLIRIEAVRIDDSSPAPLFSVVVGPSEIVKEAGDEKRELAESHYLRKEFWTHLLEKARGKTTLFNNISPRFDHWIGIGGGRSGIAFNFVIYKDHGGCEIYLDRGKGSEKLNKDRFDQLFSHKTEIEKSLADKKIIWERLDLRRSSRIRINIPGIGIRDKENWPKLQDDMIDTMIRMKEIFNPLIRSLKD